MLTITIPQHQNDNADNHYSSTSEEGASFWARNKAELISILAMPVVAKASHIEITVSDDAVLQDYVARLILRNQLANENLVRAGGPSNLFDANQEKQLIAHIKKNQSMFEISIPQYPNQPLQYTVHNEAELKAALRDPKVAQAFTVDINLKALLLESPWAAQAATVILENLLANKNLVAGGTSHNSGNHTFLTPEQYAQLNSHVIKNKTMKASQSDRSRLHRWSTLGAALATIIAILSGQTFLWVLIMAAASALTAYPLRKIHNLVTKADIYQNIPSNEAYYSPTEKKALKLGVEAGTSWKHYLISFKKPSAYRHPEAFRAAMLHAEESNHEQINAIHKLK